MRTIDRGPDWLPSPFTGLLERTTLDRERASVCLIDEHGVIAFVNRAWDRFAEDNHGPESLRSPRVLGARWVDGLGGGRARAFFGAMVAEVLSARPGETHGLTFVGECNSATVRRELATRMLPVFDAAHDKVVGVLAMNDVVSERPIEVHYELHDADDATFRDPLGRLRQCFGCRRVQAVSAPSRWAFVAAYVEQLLPDRDTLLCPTCDALYYRQFMPREEMTG